MTVIAIANQKGGCGKTTTAINLSACLGRQSQRTLLLDMDPQGHASLGLKQQTSDQPGLYEALVDEISLSEVIVSDVLEGVDLVPATISLAAADHLLSAQFGHEQKLSLLLQQVRDEYDYIVIDCPPSLGMLSVNGLLAADQVLVPVEMGLFSLDGVSRLRETIDLVSDQYERKIPVRILPTMIDMRTRLARSFMQHLEEFSSSELSSVSISQTVKLRESVCEGRAVIDYAPRCNAAQDYARLAQEFILGVTGLEIADELAKQETMASPDEHEDVGVDEVEIEEIEVEEIEAEGIDVDEGDVEESRYATLRVVNRDATQADSHEVVLNYHDMAGRDIQIAGDFNDWVPDKNVETRVVDDTLIKVFQVDPGAYQYRVIIDGIWQHDPNNSETIKNDLGGDNSLLKVSA
jgi:chromosome partitioning protein